VRYHLEKPSVNSTDAKIALMRSTATINGHSELSLEKAHILMAGIQSIVFASNSILNPTIEYKLNKVHYQTGIKYTLYEFKLEKPKKFISRARVRESGK